MTSEKHALASDGSEAQIQTQAHPYDGLLIVSGETLRENLPMSKSYLSLRAYRRGASIHLSMVLGRPLSFQPWRNARTQMKASKIFNSAQIGCGVQVRLHHGRKQTQILTTATVFDLEQFRLSDVTINGMILSSLLPGYGRQGTLRESFGEELQAVWMTAIISGLRYGSTFGSSLVIFANSNALATRFDHASEDNTRRPSRYSVNGEKIDHIRGKLPQKSG